MAKKKKVKLKKSLKNDRKLKKISKEMNMLFEGKLK